MGAFYGSLGCDISRCVLPWHASETKRGVSLVWVDDFRAIDFATCYVVVQAEAAFYRPKAQLIVPMAAG